MLERPIAMRADIKDIDIPHEAQQFPLPVDLKARRFMPIRYRFDLVAPVGELVRHLPGVDRGSALRRIPFKIDQIADVHFSARLSDVFKELEATERGAPDDFTVFLVLVTVLIITVQCVMNIGMNLGLLPVAGIGLPLLSYGGSSLVVFLAMLGVIQSIAAHRPHAG